MMQKDLLVSQLPDILHSVAEKVRGMTEEEYDLVYHNPSSQPNNDQPDNQPITEYDQIAEDIYEAEMKSMGGGNV